MEAIDRRREAAAAAAHSSSSFQQSASQFALLEHQRRLSHSSDTAVLNFYTDDRLELDMAVDYSSQDFRFASIASFRDRGASRHSLAAIDAASRTALDSGGSSSGIRVRQQGDTTIMTEHRDPYSFYWQLDQARRERDSPPRRAPPTDYVVDEELVEDETVLSPDSHDSGIHVESQYSRPQRQIEEPPLKQLPAGWERHQDPSGFSYYWHVDSGTIQREPPIVSARPPIPVDEPAPPPLHDHPPLAPPPSSAARHVVQSVQTQADAPPQQPVIEEHAFKQTTTKRRIEHDAESEEGDDDETRKAIDVGKPVRFAVRSLGWTEIAEEDLTAEKSSRAVNRAIVELSSGRNALNDNVAKWGDGRELIMQLDDNELTLIDPDTMAPVHAERIQQIRVWGVGRDNGRDFAYVTRDRGSRRFLCHVFRCDTPARTIANTLRDICKRLMLQRRPNNLMAIEKAPERRVTRESSLPTPIEEPRKVIRCHFLGVTQVPRATGIEILNEAVDRLVSQVRQDRWILVDVAIAPSTITITEVGANQIAECRVRYLSFLGIGRDVKHCAFIMHTSSENFMCYVFHVEPSAGAMAKTIEAACKLRYQKVLDAHTARIPPNNGKVLVFGCTEDCDYFQGWGDSLRDTFGSVRDRLSIR